ncbi:MAG: class I SAM-dependent methyltransferase [Methanobrevibacter sp.]|nr:class I SAM-dependent methyltransferase [Methanobrevibacter sp.]
MLDFLPYLLQDLWELGSNPEDIINLIEKYMDTSEESNILDLACGKGAVAIKIAKSLNVKVTGIDLIPEFIEYASQKANKLSADTFCHFKTEDINESVLIEKNYDCVILGSAGNILGTPEETLHKLKLPIKPHGYIIIYDVCLRDTAKKEDIKYKDHDYLNYEQWLNTFSQSDLKLIEAIPNKKASRNDSNNKAIMNRAHELASIHTEKEPIFENFIDIQLNGSYDLKNSVTGITWLLQPV